MSATIPCPTCAILAHIMGGCPDPIGYVVASVLACVAKMNVKVPDIVAVVGSLDADLPSIERARGPFMIAVMNREDVFAWALGNPVREAVVAGLRTELPEGRFWTLAATRSFAVAFHHDMRTPSPLMTAIVDLSVVPDDGGPSLGARMTRKGGSA